MPYVITQTEYVEINSVPLSTPAWETVDLSPLWDTPPTRGDDRVVPYQEGVTPLQRIYGAWPVSLPMVIYGDRNSNDVAQADPRIGLRANIDELQSLVINPTATASPGTKVIRLHLPDLSVRVGLCEVLSPLNFGATLGPGAVRAVLDIVIVDGPLT